MLKENTVFRRREVGKLLNNIGNTCEAAGETDSALYYYHKALYTVADIDTANIFSLPTEKNLYAENTILESLDNMANCMTAHCNEINQQPWLSHAAACYALSMETERKLMLNFSYDESKYLMLQSSRKRSEKAIDVCYRLYHLTHNNKWVDKSFQFAEKNKAFVLLESVKRNLASSVLQGDSLYQQLQQKQAAYALAERNITEATLQNDTAFLQQYSVQLKDADAALQKAKSNFEFTNTSYRSLMEKEDSININAVSKLLTDNSTALPEYFSGDSAAYCFYISNAADAGIFKLESSFNNVVDSVLTFFKAKNIISENPVAYNAAAYRLYQLLQLPNISKPVSKLIIIPDGAISFVPFDALVITHSSSPELASYNYAVKNFEIRYGFSAAILLAQLQQQNKNN
ncbi:MAG TPA: hypothetical protein PL045_13545, partial [Chitinophagaceae bacterium]|nr:hypothetical protein [Chitinophagaceae bacterium]